MILPEGGNLSADHLRRVEYFTQEYCQLHERLYRYGWGHLLFACYAAFPAHLSPDLLHKLRLNFRHFTEDNEQKEISPITVNDLLLSNLVQETGHERYEMLEPIRHYLLWLLQHSGFFEKKAVSPLQHFEKVKGETAAVTRLNHLAAFLMRYAADFYSASDGVTRSLREAQEWTAQAWLNPGQAAQRIREKLANETATPNERFQYGRLGNRLAAQYQLHLNPAAKGAPASFLVLHAYTQGITSLYSGKNAQAQTHFKSLLHLKTSDAQPGSANTNVMRLPVPKEVAAQLMVDNSDQEKIDSINGKKTAKPLYWDSRRERLKSPFPKAVLTIEDAEIDLLLLALKRMEQQIARAVQPGAHFTLGDFFDYFVGTGRGAFMAIALAGGKRMDQIESDVRSKQGAYLREGTQMMGSDGLREILMEYFGDTEIHENTFKSGLLLAVPGENSQPTQFFHNFYEGPGKIQSDLLPTLEPRGTATNSLLFDSMLMVSKSLYNLRTQAASEVDWWVSLDVKGHRQETPPATKKGNQETAVDALNKHLRSDMRWLEQHTMELIGRDRFFFETWDCHSESPQKVNWPANWYQKPESAAAETAPTSEPPIAPQEIYVVTAKSINWRVGPSIEMAILGELPLGTKLLLLNQTEEWSFVQLVENTEGTNTGWVNNNFIQKLEQEIPTDRKLDPAIYEYLKLGEIEKCLELLPKSDPNALLIRAEFTSLQRSQNLGLITHQEYQTNWSSIASKVLDFAQKFESGESTGPVPSTDFSTQNTAQQNMTQVPSSYKKQVQDLIAEARIEEVFELLPKDNNEILQFSARYRYAKREYNMGLVDFGFWSRVLSRINMALLQFVDRSSPKFKKTGDPLVNSMRTRIAEGNLVEAFNTLNESPIYAQNPDFLRVKAKFDDMSRKKNMGLTGEEEQLLEFSKTTFDLLELLDS